jgi:uncharacterized membrane protein HdeD (DUF308 family)
MEASAPQTGPSSAALRYGGGDASDIAPGAGRQWWYFLVTGSVWAIFALTVFRFDLDSAGTIGAVVGVVCIVAGIAQFMALGVSSTGWRIVRVVLGLLFVAVGVVALAYPHRTFAEIAAIFAFFLAIKGFFDIMSSLMLRHENDLWWATLIVGVVEILLAFWCAGNFGREAVLLVVWVGAAALAQAVTDFALAMRLYALRGKSGPGTPAPA